MAQDATILDILIYMDRKKIIGDTVVTRLSPAEQLY